MSRSAYLVCVLFLACSCFTPSASGARNYRRGYKTTEPPTTTPPPLTPKEFLDSSPGISTFGIIAIIFTVIVLCLIFYYGIICYPLFFRDEKKYRFMDVSSTITAATSRSIQSIENYPDQKHHHQLA